MTAFARSYKTSTRNFKTIALVERLRRLCSEDPMLLALTIGIVALIAMFCLFAMAQMATLFGADAFGDFLRDAGQQVGGAGGVGAAGAAGAGGAAGGGSPADRGFTYGRGDVHSGPSYDSSVVGNLPNGGRELYTETTTVNGETWYHVSPPGGGSGWIPANQTTSTRPTVPPPTPPTHVNPSGVGLAETSGAQTAGSRG